MFFGTSLFMESDSVILKHATCYLFRLVLFCKVLIKLPES